MAQVRSALRSGTGRVVIAALLLLGAVTVTPMLSGAASAQRAHLDASVSCDGTVEWKATSWADDQDGGNRDVKIHRSADGGAEQEVGHGSFGAENGYSFSGSFEWPEGATTVVVSTSPESEWGSGDKVDHDEGDDEVKLDRPDCDDDGHVDHELRCDDSAPGYGDGTVTLTLTNPSGPFGGEAHFDVYDPDQSDRHSSYTVPSGGSQQVEYGQLGEGRHHIKVIEDGDDHSRDIEIDCDQAVPSVHVTTTCVYADGSITVDLFNTGGEVATYTVEDPVTHTVETIEVQPNDSESRTFGGLADGDYTVKVHSGDADFSKHVTVDCDEKDDPKGDDHDDDPKPPKDDDHDDECPVDDDDDDDHGSSTSTSMKDDDDDHDSSTSSSVKGGGGYESRTYVTTTTQKPYGSSTSTSMKDDDDDHDSSTSTSMKDDDDDHDSSTSTSVKDDDDDPCNPPEKSEGTIEVAKVCVAQDGQVTVTLIVSDGDTSVTFVVEGETYVVGPGERRDVVIGGLVDGTHTISVKAGKKDLSFQIDIHCDLSPRVTVQQECVAFDGAVSFLLENLGDDLDATFTINGVDHVVAPGASATVVIDGLADGEHTFTVAINGYSMPDVKITVDCDPAFDIVAQCDAVSHEGTVDVYWFTITNTEASDIEVSWDGGSVVVPAGESRTIGSHTAPLELSHNGQVIATAEASGEPCTRDVTFEKQLIGGPDAPETYTITVSRLVGDTFVPETTFDLTAGTPVTITLPSTLDPAGVEYVIEETDAGSANTSVVTPGDLRLSGHLGETISVVVTNGYAAVQIDKEASATQVGAGGSLTYTLQATNTGGLTLDPVVITDRLPAEVAYVSAAVADDGGTCSLTESTRPQLVTCDMSGALAAGASTPLITIQVRVDDLTANPGLADETLTNQAKVLGTYATPATARASETDPDKVLSCLPAVQGTVCDLSPAVAVTIVGSEPPPTTGVPTTTTPGSTTTAPPGPLPRTGGSSPLPLLVIGLGFACIGGSLLLTRRRA